MGKDAVAIPQTVPLTEQQQAVVNHNDGPALVFAVAGAGKTTAMVHRIERLVREGVFAPGQILATSFGRANVVDLKNALAPWPHCRHVDGRTLHSLGRDIIKQAQQLGHLRSLRLNQQQNGDGNLEQRLLSQAMAEARRQNLPYKKELDGLDRQDFLDYVGACKGNLLYADFKRVDLPSAARSAAGQAPDPSEQLTWYLDLYRLFERIRVKQGGITFSDMLMTGWEALVTLPDVLAKVQQRYKTVLVDEFQDINLAQSEILHLIAAPHGNYMAIGDDDQTIYEWRGASPSFILDFPKRYEASTYLISDNFRCPAAPLVLANRVIEKNTQRQPKRLNLTRGFFGETAVHTDTTINSMGHHIVQRIGKLHKGGMPLNDIAVLVRLNAQTPPIEQQLIEHNIPYRVSQPFYERNEIKTLIQYCRIAWIEKEIRGGKRPLINPNARHTFDEAWRNICNRPKRYISSELRRRLFDLIVRQGRPVSAILQDTAEQSSKRWLREPLTQLADDIAWLSNQLGKSAEKTLRLLDIRLDYQTFLRTSSGFEQTGEGRAISVTTFIRYAKDHGSLLNFMTHLRELARQKVGQATAEAKDAVTLSTIHQAKGLEWPTVIVAQCNENVIPFLSERVTDQAEQSAALAEERRLLYVALTRTRKHLHIHTLKKEPISRFLTEATYQTVLADVPKIEAILAKPTQKWQAAEAYLIAKQTNSFHFQRFFKQWWDVSDEEKTAVSHTILHFLHAAQHHNLWLHLTLTQTHIDFWDTLTPSPFHLSGQRSHTPSTFPGLNKLKPSTKNQKRRKSSKPAPPPPILDEPDIIMPGMWLRCDVGWGQIEQILDVVKRPLSHTERTNTFVRYIITLRPEQDAEPVEIDVSASRIHFTKAKQIFTCTKCLQFTAATEDRVTNDHTNAAHDGVSPAFKPERKPERKLGELSFSMREPEGVNR
ncbi:MAG: ATP-dependent helicase [Chloroflexi bacterium]|nr:ATP-dependent helicase [Chloroflexota bacterium]